MHDVHDVPEWVPLSPTVVGLSGIALAYIMYMFAPSLPGKLASTFRGIYLFLLNKWYFDELYDAHLRPPDPRPGAHAVAEGRRRHHRRRAQRRRRARGRGRRTARSACRPGVSPAMPSS